MRNHNTLKRDAVIKQIASAVGPEHPVDLQHYDRLILLEVYKVCASDPSRLFTRKLLTSASEYMRDVRTDNCIRHTQEIQSGRDRADRSRSAAARLTRAPATGGVYKVYHHAGEVNSTAKTAQT